MTILDVLRGVNAYPIPLRTIEEIAVRRALTLTSEADVAILNSREFNLSKGDLYLWLSNAPDVSQGGQSYRFSDEDKKQFRLLANLHYGIAGESLDDSLMEAKPVFGYKGSSL